jgi:hypothetical protein
MQATIKRKDAVVLYANIVGILSLEGFKFTVGFQHWLYKNRKNLEFISNAMANFRSKTMKAFDEKRIALCEKYCERDAKEKPVMKNGEYQIPKDSRANFDVTIGNIRAEHKADFDVVEAYAEEIIQIDLIKKPLADIENVELPAGFIETIMLIIAD